jgi:hypothetical protein
MTGDGSKTSRDPKSTFYTRHSQGKHFGVSVLLGYDVALLIKGPKRSRTFWHFGPWKIRPLCCLETSGIDDLVKRHKSQKKKNFRYTAAKTLQTRKVTDFKETKTKAFPFYYIKKKPLDRNTLTYVSRNFTVSSYTCYVLV